MKAKMLGGPYDGIELNVKDDLQHLILQVNVSPAIQIADAVTYVCLARYECIMKNDVVAHFRFRSLSSGQDA
jgi:hypothetical protein